MAWRGRPVAAIVHREPEVLRVAYTGRLDPEPQFVSPGQAQFPRNFLTLSLWEGLVETNPRTGEPVSAMAKSWSLSADRLTLVLELRDDARWTNGDPVVAEDFLRAWRRLLGRRDAQALFFLAGAAEFARTPTTGFERVGVRAPGPHTLELRLAAPLASVMAELANPLLVPLHATTPAVLDGGVYRDRPAALVTNGPFKLVRINADGLWLERNAQFREAAQVRLSGVRLVQSDTPEIACLQLDAGVVDYFGPLPTGPLDLVPLRPGVVRRQEPVNFVNSIDFNFRRGPLQDERVRRALALALDRAGPIRQFKLDYVRPARGWVPPLAWRLDRELVGEDVAEAKRLLAEAGYGPGKEMPVLWFAMPMAMQGNIFPVMWAERWYRELGVRTYLSYETSPRYRQRLSARDYDIVIGRWIGTAPEAGDLLSVFGQPGGMLTTGWRDETVASWLQAADQTDGAARAELLDKVEQRALASWTAIPALFYFRVTRLSEEVHGWYPDVMARQSARHLWLERREASP